VTVPNWNSLAAWAIVTTLPCDAFEDFKLESGRGALGAQASLPAFLVMSGSWETSRQGCLRSQVLTSTDRFGIKKAATLEMYFMSFGNCIHHHGAHHHANHTWHQGSASAVVTRQ
jgi:hypothetical protein